MYGKQRRIGKQHIGCVNKEVYRERYCIQILYGDVSTEFTTSCSIKLHVQRGTKLSNELTNIAIHQIIMLFRAGTIASKTFTFTSKANVVQAHTVKPGESKTWAQD